MNAHLYSCTDNHLAEAQHFLIHKMDKLYCPLLPLESLFLFLTWFSFVVGKIVVEIRTLNSSLTYDYNSIDSINVKLKFHLEAFSCNEKALFSCLRNLSFRDWT